MRKINEESMKGYDELIINYYKYTNKTQQPNDKNKISYRQKKFIELDRNIRYSLSQNNLKLRERAKLAFPSYYYGFFELHDICFDPLLTAYFLEFPIIRRIIPCSNELIDIHYKIANESMKSFKLSMNLVPFHKLLTYINYNQNRCNNIYDEITNSNKLKTVPRLELDFMNCLMDRNGRSLILGYGVNSYIKKYSQLVQMLY